MRSDRDDTISAAVPAELRAFVPQLQAPASTMFAIPVPVAPKPDSDGADADVETAVDTAEDVATQVRHMTDPITPKFSM